MFLPNTYQFYWNVPVEKFFDKMFSEFNTFWTKERLDKAKNMKFTPNEIIILASIVEKEIIRKEEAERIAGVFINRLKLFMPGNMILKMATMTKLCDVQNLDITHIDMEDYLLDQYVYLLCRLSTLF